MSSSLVINSVTGVLTRDEVGICMPHEHLWTDLSPWLYHIDCLAAKEPIQLSNLWWIRQNPQSHPENLKLNDFDAIVSDLREFADLGGRTVVELSNYGLARNVHRLVEISNSSAIHVIAGTGFYVEHSYPPSVKRMNTDEITDLMIKELKEGISGTSIKAGIIGELGATNPLGINEKQVLIAGAQAQVETGAAINVHVDPFSMGGEHEVLDILQNAGANRIVLSHMDVRLLLDQRSLSKGMKLLVSLAESGAFIEFDTWGLNDFDARRSMRRPSDWERLCVLRELCDQGFTSQVLISQDISMKTKLRKYGGFGIGYILREIVPRMRMMGFDPEMIQTILVRNPADLLFGPLDDESPES